MTLRPQRSPRQDASRRTSRPADTAGAVDHLHVDIIIESPLWGSHGDIEAAVHRTIAAAVADAIDGEVAVLLADDATVRDMNARWRGKEGATNVLSFPPGPGAEARHLGDIVIAYETAAEEARLQGKPFDHHLAHLVVHGFLHLLGYDHESDANADAMERRERDILARLEIPDPYAAPEV